MPESRIYPRLQSFERLAISDGLTINAQRWQQAHGYHRQRQNFHYQALYQPGIIYGLGVAPVPDQPDGRLLQIQPGVAIDIEGNPIILRQPEEFRVASDATDTPLLVHLAVNYVDPDQLRRLPTSETVQETFRIVEKLQLAPGDVEICRILLQPGASQISPPVNLFQPTDNELNLLGRRVPQPYSPLSIQVGVVTSNRASDRMTLNGLSDLVRSLKGLYPSLWGNPTVRDFSVQELGRSAIEDCQLLSIPYPVLLALSNLDRLRLGEYLTQGNVLLVVADFAEIGLLELLDIGQELRAGLTEAERDRDLFAQVGAQLKAEIVANLSAITRQQAELEQPLVEMATQLGLSLSSFGDLDQDHPLRWQPFSFSQLPVCPDHPIYLKNWEGLVLMLGDLSCCWGHATLPDLPRDVLRSAQEWGINLLHFAAQRYQWVQAMQPYADRTAIAAPSDSLQQRVQPS
jgi:hypothetical protein